MNWKTRSIGYRTVLESLLTQLLVLTVRNLELPENMEPTAEFSLSDRNDLIIEESFLYEYRDLTLEKLSSRLALSPRQTEPSAAETLRKDLSPEKV